MNNLAEKIADSEVEIMKVLWDKGDSITFTDIRSVVIERTGWDIATVNTLVKRLVKKGVLKQEKHDVYFYTALVTEADYMQLKTKSLVENVYGGDLKGLLTTLLQSGDVSEEDLNELRNFWASGGKNQ